MRLGIFGGTFDPPHLGHTQLALFTLSEKNLDKIIFVPAFHAPYPDKSASTSFDHRFSMTELAVQNYPQFEISGVEGERGGNSFTIDTIRHFKKEYSLSSGEIFLIVGADSFKRFDEWKDPKALLMECSVCVLKRIGAEIDFTKDSFGEFDQDDIARVELLDNELIETSSSDLRERISSEADLTKYLDDKVIGYIRRNRLYGSGQGPSD